MSFVPNYFHIESAGSKVAYEWTAHSIASDDISIIITKNVIESKKVQKALNPFQNKSVKKVLVENKDDVQSTNENPYKKALFLNPFLYQSSYL
ncbi:hypothetical protein [Bacillus sp. E(2018)]|uniref:hypothetical protein n=1 Tax=Bacillus sp. E(2018) TaxID=2502239 RepID=UPI0010F78BA9|nr:hypothetical protein [Bacillus sp. E(2018)]